MPIRVSPLVTGEYYHVFNRGVAKSIVFFNKRCYQRFLQTFLYYQQADKKPRYSHLHSYSYKDFPFINNINKRKLVDIVCYCLMPNHFHFLLRQNLEGGISEFVSKTINSYTRFINVKFDRVGPLFQGMFKAIHIDCDEYLIHLSRYIHLNPINNFLIKDINLYEWSSYREYVNNQIFYCEKKIILDQFNTEDSYEKFVLDQQDYLKNLEKIKNLTLDT